ncbi:SLBB domain-containing protein [bacterium]|nr:SLBB domain-containing protein [bacterium]
MFADSSKKVTWPVPSFNMDVAVDPQTYHMGPGDQLSVSIGGPINENFKTVVSPEGVVILPSAREVMLWGLTLSEAKVKIIEILRAMYIHANISVNLIGLRTMAIDVAGFVEHNGRVDISPVERVTQAIQKAGGFLNDASRRNIQVRKKNGETLRVDIVKRNNTGNLEWDIALSNGDIIYVPPAYASIYVYGAVSLPGQYEFVKGERILDIVELCAGLKFGADSTQVELVRFQNDTGKVIQRFNLSLCKMIECKDDPAINMLLCPDDRIYFRFVPQFHPMANITIEGEIIYPGVYSIVENKTKLSDVLNAAGGFSNQASVNKIMIYRDKKLEGEDLEYNRLKLTQASDMTEIEQAYFKAKSRQEYLTVQTDFDQLFKNGKIDEKYDIMLRRGDVINVSPVKHTVSVIGGVVRPGILDWKIGLNYKDYINKTGGFKSSAKRSDVRIIRDFGQHWIDASNSSEIKDGDVIFIPEKKPLDAWKVFKDTMAFIGQLATVTATIILIYSQVHQNK